MRLLQSVGFRCQVAQIGLTLWRSPVQMKAKDARWPDEVEAKVFLSESDRIQMQVVHKGGRGQQDRVVETWEATMTTAPDKAKGNTKLKPESLKRLVVRSYFSE